MKETIEIDKEINYYSCFKFFCSEEGLFTAYALLLLLCVHYYTRTGTRRKSLSTGV